MKRAWLIGMAITLLTCPGLLAGGDDIPGLTVCEFIVLRTSEGWWLRVDNDGSGSYGFGALIEKLSVKKNVYDFKQVYADTRKAAVKNRENAEEPYCAVSFFVAGSGSAREFYLLRSRPLIAKLFLSARANTLAPANEIEARARDMIESFWKNSPAIDPGMANTSGVE